MEQGRSAMLLQRITSLNLSALYSRRGNLGESLDQKVFKILFVFWPLFELVALL